jgi:hypothetical protein
MPFVDLYPCSSSEYEFRTLVDAHDYLGEWMPAILKQPMGKTSSTASAWSPTLHLDLPLSSESLPLKKRLVLSSPGYALDTQVGTFNNWHQSFCQESVYLRSLKPSEGSLLGRSESSEGDGVSDMQEGLTLTMSSSSSPSSHETARRTKRSLTEKLKIGDGILTSFCFPLFSKFNSTGVHYLGFEDRFDETFTCESSQLAPFRTKSARKVTTASEYVDKMLSSVWSGTNADRTLKSNHVIVRMRCFWLSESGGAGLLRLLVPVTMTMEALLAEYFTVLRLPSEHLKYASLCQINVLQAYHHILDKRLDPFSKLSAGSCNISDYIGGSTPGVQILSKSFTVGELVHGDHQSVNFDEQSNAALLLDVLLSLSNFDNIRTLQLSVQF